MQLWVKDPNELPVADFFFFGFLNLTEEGLAVPCAILLILISSSVFCSSALLYNTSGVIPYLPYDMSPVSLQNKALLTKG